MPPKPAAKGKGKGTKAAVPTGPKQTPEEAHAILKSLIHSQDISEVKTWTTKRCTDLDNKIGEVTQFISKLRHQQGLPPINAAALATATRKDNPTTTSNPPVSKVIPTVVPTNYETNTANSSTTTTSGTLVSAENNATTTTVVAPSLNDNGSTPENSSSNVSSSLTTTPSPSALSSVTKAGVSFPPPPSRIPGFGKANLYSPYGLINYSISPTASFLLNNNNTIMNSTTGLRMMTNGSTTGTPTVTNVSSSVSTSSSSISPTVPSVAQTLCTKLGTVICQSLHCTYPPPNKDTIFTLFKDYDTSSTGTVSISDIHDIFMLKGIDITLSNDDGQVLYTNFGKQPIIPNETVKTKMIIDYSSLVNAMVNEPLPSTSNVTVPIVPAPTTTNTDTTINANSLPIGPTVPPRSDAPAYPTIQDLAPVSSTVTNTSPSLSTAPTTAVPSTVVMPTTTNPATTVSIQPSPPSVPTDTTVNATPITTSSSAVNHPPSASTSHASATKSTTGTTSQSKPGTTTATKKPTTAAPASKSTPTTPTTSGSKTASTNKPPSRPGSTAPHATSSNTASSRRTSTASPAIATTKPAATSSSSRRPSQVQNNLPSSNTSTTPSTATVPTTTSTGLVIPTPNTTQVATTVPNTATNVSTVNTSPNVNGVPPTESIVPSSSIPAPVTNTSSSSTAPTATTNPLGSTSSSSTMNLMVPIPVTITMGPNGPMAIPMTMGSMTATPYLAPVTNTTNNTTDSALPTDTSSTAAAERELALLTKLKETMKVNEALKAELSNFDETFFEEIEDVKYRLAIAEGKVVPASTAATEPTNEAKIDKPSGTDKAEEKKETNNGTDGDSKAPKSSSSTAPSRRVSIAAPTPAPISSTAPTTTSNTATVTSTDKKEPDDSISSGSTTTQHIEAGLTQGRKMFHATWEQTAASPPRDLPNLIGAPLSPNGLPMFDTNTAITRNTITRTSPVRGSPITATTNETNSTNTTNTNSFINSKPQGSTFVRTTNTNEVQQLRSAWNAVAFAPKPKPLPVAVPDVAKDLAKTEFNNQPINSTNPSVTVTTAATNTATTTTTASRRPSTAPVVPAVASFSSSTTTGTTAATPTEPSGTIDKPPSAAAVIASRRSSAVLEAAAATIKTADTVLVENNKARGLPPRAPTPGNSEAVVEKTALETPTKVPVTVENAVKQSIAEVEATLVKAETKNNNDNNLAKNTISQSTSSVTGPVPATDNTVPSAIRTVSPTPIVESSTSVPSIRSSASSPSKDTNTVTLPTVPTEGSNSSSSSGSIASSSSSSNPAPIVASAVDDLLPLPSTNVRSSSPSRATLSPLNVNTLNNNFDGEEEDYSIRNNNPSLRNDLASPTKDGKEDRILIVAGRAVVIPTPQPPKNVTDIEDNMTVTEAFPTATEGNYAVRVMVRKALAQKLDDVNSPFRTKAVSPNPNADSSDGTVPPSSHLPTVGPSDDGKNAVPDMDLYGILVSSEREALALAFDRYEEKENHVGPRPRIAPSVNKAKEKLKHTITPLDFERGLISLGLRLNTDEIAELISGLRLDRSGRVEYSDFLRFISLPLVLTPEDKDTLITTSDGVPQPPDALPSPVFDRPGNPRSPRPVFKGYTKSVKPPAKMNGPWAYADPDTQLHAPKVHVPWPVDISRADSAFWKGVNDLERLMLKEVNVRAKVQGIAPDAGLGDTSKIDRTGPRGMFDLRRAFVFFDRRSKRVISVNDLHQTLSDLGFVDPPSPVQPFGNSTGISEGKAIPIDMHPGRSIADEGDISTVPNNDTTIPAIIQPGALTSPTKLKIPSSSMTTTNDNDLSPTKLDLSPMRTSYQNDAPNNGTDSSSNTDVASNLLGDKIDAELRQGARALVVCIFKRIHGNSDPGNTGTSLLTKGEADALLRDDVGLLSGPGVVTSGGTGYPPALPPITYNVFARWAAPLSTKLRRIREKVQADFLAQATIGGGAKDFARAFHRIDANGDGQMSIQEFRETLGPIGRTLESHEMQALCDYFDASGDGIIDFGEFLGMMGGNGNAIAHALAAELDDDDEYTLPNE